MVDKFWLGEEGNAYIDRNTDVSIDARVALWKQVLSSITPLSILEVGAGNGNNLKALDLIGYKNLIGVEPNKKALTAIRCAGFDAYEGTAAKPKQKADLSFTSGVLIHIPPNELLSACQGIYNSAFRYIVCIEYFSADPEEKVYRGQVLWKRDFGSFWLDNFSLTVLDYGFVWERMTGLDNLTYWVFSK